MPSPYSITQGSLQSSAVMLQMLRATLAIQTAAAHRLRPQTSDSMVQYDIEHNMDPCRALPSILGRQFISFVVLIHPPFLVILPAEVHHR